MGEEIAEPKIKEENLETKQVKSRRASFGKSSFGESDADLSFGRQLSSKVQARYPKIK